jgi:hypothetical protein
VGWANTIVRQGPHRLSDGTRRYPRMRAQVNTNPTDGACEALRKASKLQSEVVVVKKVGRTKDKVRFPQPLRPPLYEDKNGNRLHLTNFQNKLHNNRASLSGFASDS